MKIVNSEKVMEYLIITSISSISEVYIMKEIMEYLIFDESVPFQRFTL
jgi:hypothetical protein